MRWARQSRSAGSEDNVVELMRPLGLVLNQDENGNVYVETVAPKGNAARTGKVRAMAAGEVNTKSLELGDVGLFCLVHRLMFSTFLPSHTFIFYTILLTGKRGGYCDHVQCNFW